MLGRENRGRNARRVRELEEGQRRQRERRGLHHLRGPGAGREQPQRRGRRHHLHHDRDPRRRNLILQGADAPVPRRRERQANDSWLYFPDAAGSGPRTRTASTEASSRCSATPSTFSSTPAGRTSTT